jgi:hypothetical protein
MATEVKKSLEFLYQEQDKKEHDILVASLDEDVKKLEYIKREFLEIEQRIRLMSWNYSEIMNNENTINLETEIDDDDDDDDIVFETTELKLDPDT